MAPQPNSQEPQGSALGCLLLLIILIGVPYVIRAMATTDDKPDPEAAPTSTTLQPDDAARLGCWSWRHAFDDGPYLSTKELPARMDWALNQAQESSVWEVAHAAEELQRAAHSGTTEEHGAAWEAFKRACATVGE